MTSIFEDMNTIAKLAGLDIERHDDGEAEEKPSTTKYADHDELWDAVDDELKALENEDFSDFDSADQVRNHIIEAIRIRIGAEI